MSTHSTSVRSSTEEKALKLLGQGYGAGIVASACGVSESRISQLLSDPVFAEEVASLRFASLQKHNEVDSQYDDIEKKLLDTLNDLLPLMMRPMEVLKAISVINAAKRRGASAPEQITHQNAVVNLVMPVKIVNKFTTNITNQVIQAGSQTLETVQSSALLDKLKQKSLNAPNAQILEIGEINHGNPQLAISDGTRSS